MGKQQQLLIVFGRFGSPEKYLFVVLTDVGVLEFVWTQIWSSCHGTAPALLKYSFM